MSLILLIVFVDFYITHYFFEKDGRSMYLKLLKLINFTEMDMIRKACELDRRRRNSHNGSSFEQEGIQERSVKSSSGNSSHNSFKTTFPNMH